MVVRKIVNMETPFDEVQDNVPVHFLQAVVMLDIRKEEASRNIQVVEDVMFRRNLNVEVVDVHLDGNL